LTSANPAETRNGIIPTAVLAPRGILEFYADATTPHHLPGFQTHRRVIVIHLGYHDVAHLDGGYQRWLADVDSMQIGKPMRAGVELVLPDDNPIPTVDFSIVDGPDDRGQDPVSAGRHTASAGSNKG
jgi:hypothetical protein